MNPCKTILIIGPWLFLPCWLALAEVKETRQLISEWVKTERIISEEKASWNAERELLGDLIATACSLLGLGALMAASGAVFAVPASAADIAACLITKTDINPFFVKMKEGATEKAKELGIELKSFAGKIDGDHETQVAAIETCIADGAKGILLTASDTSSIVSSVKQARDAGLLVIALDTPSGPRSFRVMAIYYDYSSDRGLVVMDRATFARHYGQQRPVSLALTCRPL